MQISAEVLEEGIAKSLSGPADAKDERTDWTKSAAR